MATLVAAPVVSVHFFRIFSSLLGPIEVFSRPSVGLIVIVVIIIRVRGFMCYRTAILYFTMKSDPSSTQN